MGLLAATAMAEVVLAEAVNAVPAATPPANGDFSGVIQWLIATYGLIGIVVGVLSLVVMKLYNETKSLQALVNQINNERIGEAETRIKDAKEMTREALNAIGAINGSIIVLTELVKNLPGDARRS